MASGFSLEEPDPDVEVLSVSRTFQPPAILRPDFVDPGRENEEPFGNFELDDQDGLLCNIGFIDDQMLMDVLQENNVIDRRTDEKFVLPPQPVEVDPISAEKMEEDDIQVIFEGVKRPRNSQNKVAATHAKELKKLTVSNGRLTKQNESLLQQLEDLKLEVAHQKSRNFLAQHEHCNQVLDVLNTELTCVICSDIIIEAVAIECGHIFCSHCISTWFSQQLLLNSRSCPTCRTVTYRDPVKISNLNSTIASFHTLLSQEVQSDRRQLLEDRKTEQKKVEEASAGRSRARTHRPIHVNFGLNRAQDQMAQLARSVSRRMQRLSPDITATERNPPGQGQPTSVQQAPTLVSNVLHVLRSGHNPRHPIVLQPLAPVRPVTSRSSAYINNPYRTANVLRFTPAHLATPTPSVAATNQTPPGSLSNDDMQQMIRRFEVPPPLPQIDDYRNPDPRRPPY